MLESKIVQNSIQEGIEKRMRKRERLGGVLEALGGGFDASREAKERGTPLDRRKFWNPVRSINEF